MKRILIAAQNQQAAAFVQQHLKAKYKVDIVENTDSCQTMFRKRRYEFVFVEIGILQESASKHGMIAHYKQALAPFWKIFPEIQIIVLSPPDKIRDVVAAVKAGASNYLTYPIDPTELQYIVESAYESARIQLELDYLRDQFWKSDSLELVRTKSPAMRQMLDKVKAVAPTNTTVLLCGETGVGKGVVARLIHHHSNRSEMPFISVHCGAIPDTLLESELFGHEKGAFTGAVRKKLGKFEIAREGTIFLDEIGTITSSAQIKLLQVLQERIFQRVGGEENVESNVRIIAATNADLKQMVEEGTFRRDLYYRLNIFPIQVPSLRERNEDIPVLIEIFLDKLNKFHQKNVIEVHPQVIDALRRYSWPGNIRELENLIERAYILETSSLLSPESFPNEIFECDETIRPPFLVDTSLTLAEIRAKALEDVERQYLKEILAMCRGRIDKTSQTAGIGPRQLHKLLSKYGIRKEDFKNHR